MGGSDILNIDSAKGGRAQYGMCVLVIRGGVELSGVGAWALAPTFRNWLPLGQVQDTRLVFSYTAAR